MKIVFYTFIFFCIFLLGFIFSFFLIYIKSISTEPFLDNVKDLNDEKQDIAVFFHLGTEGVSWLRQANLVLEALENSNLLYESKYNFICVSDNITLPQSFRKWNVIYLENAKSKFEIATLEYIYSFSLTHSETKILYLHNKGATRVSKAVMDWVEYALYFYVTRWREMILHLETHDVVFIDFTPPVPNSNVPYIRIAANFWWTKGSYAASLPPPHYTNYRYFFNTYNKEMETSSVRFNGELWIVLFTSKCLKTEPLQTCKELDKFCTVFQSNVDHYLNEYPSDRYINANISQCLKIPD